MTGPADRTSPAPVLLTGATGFIGRHIQSALLEAGYPVRAVVRPGSRNSRHADGRSEIAGIELRPGPALDEALRGCRAVIYGAGSVRGRSMADFLPANVDGVRSIVAALAAHGTAVPLLLISSLAAERPELSDYARSKHLGEIEAQRHAAGHWTILRPTAVYGPGDREMRPVLGMARRGLIAQAGPAGQRVSLIYVGDLAAAVLAWLRTWPASAGGTYAIDDGRAGGYDWQAIVAAAGRDRARIFHVPGGLLRAVAASNLAASRLLGYAPMLTPGKVRELTEPEWLCDNSAFTAATGWRPQTDLARGLRLTWNEPTD